MNINDNQKKYYKALQIACIAHKDQIYDREHGYPYMLHLISVTEVLSRFDFSINENPELHISAIFHDIIEDQDMKYKDIEKDFGKEIADIVFLCTDDIVMAAQGASRHERHAVTYPKLAKNDKSIVIKLCDRISNVEYGISNDNLKQYRKYRREYKFFRDTLKKDTMFGEKTNKMWEHLDSLFDWTE